ncbi:MAG: copper amine oxidase N-terminal domain-containing protein [Oscillospiraceae bacterium]|nr:copper amine oxidase N-terminal domain-containing protein [Oscillospiraceae bacterium]
MIRNKKNIIIFILILIFSININAGAFETTPSGGQAACHPSTEGNFHSISAFYSLFPSVEGCRPQTAGWSSLCFNTTLAINIKLREDYISPVIPGEFDLNITAFKSNGEDLLYIKLDENTEIFLDLLFSTGVINATERRLLNNYYNYDENPAFLRIAPDDLNKYFEKIGDKFTLDIKFTDSDNIINPDNIDGEIYYYPDIRNKINKELAKTPGYRYSEIYIIIETVNSESFMHILAEREDGVKEILEKIGLGCDASNAHTDQSSVFSENILPVRYIFELLGETVGWDSEIEDENNRAYIIKDGNLIYFNGQVIDSRIYISAAQIMSNTDYMLTRVSLGEYIEIKIARR